MTEQSDRQEQSGDGSKARWQIHCQDGSVHVELGVPLVNADRAKVVRDAGVLNVQARSCNPHYWSAEVTHRCPPQGSGVMPCCGRTPFEVPRYHRMTVEDEVTCDGS